MPWERHTHRACALEHPEVVPKECSSGLAERGGFSAREPRARLQMVCPSHKIDRYEARRLLLNKERSGFSGLLVCTIAISTWRRELHFVLGESRVSSVSRSRPV